MNSHLYDCTLMHHRLKPRRHHFSYKVFMFYLDLNEIDDVCRIIPFISRNKPNLYSFRDTDHLQTGATTVRENLEIFLKERGIIPKPGRIMLLTNLRTFGYVFNPASFYFCYDENNKPLAIVAEVNNTFGETKPFVLLQNGEGPEDVFTDRQDKLFYISPFFELDLSLDFKLRMPGDRLQILIRDFRDDEMVFHAALTGKSRPLTGGNVFRSLLRYPLLTLRIIVLIHWHAFLLYMKKIPYHRKANNPQLQKGILHTR